MNTTPGAPAPRGAGRRAGRPLYHAKAGAWLGHGRPAAPRSLDARAGGVEQTRASRLRPRFLDVGDTGLSVEFGAEIDPAANDAVAALDAAIAASEMPGIVETVPSFRSLLVVFEPALVERAALLSRLRRLASGASSVEPASRRRWSIPVVHEAPFGEDLAEVGSLLGMSRRDVVSAHTGAEFRVYMIGFQPGLPNLGGLPRALHVSRRTTPRAPVPGGSVMIGGVQGAIMPFPTPSGFYLLGRTPVRLFDRRRPEAALLRPGDTVRFREICAGEYARIVEAVAAGDFDAGVTFETVGVP